VNETSLTYIQILPEIKKEVKPQVDEFAGRRSNRSSYLTAVGQFSSKAKSLQVRAFRSCRDVRGPNAHRVTPVS
jgi:hypothetical protein